MTAIAGREQLCRVRGIKICFEEIGDPDGEPLLLIMGLGGQMIAWPTEFCEQLAARGFRVIRFDNRDCGRSTHFADTQPPSTWSILRRRPRPAGYTLDDMAADAIGLLDHLEIQRAHVIGASMGGMIAQVIATRAPRRVRSLTSIRSSTGSRWRGQPRARMWPLLLGGPATDRTSYEERFVRFAKAIASPGFATDEPALRELARASFDRGFDEGGTRRQLGAVIASGDRTRSLARIEAPTLVIHGTDDPLIRVSGGRATARAIPGAELMLIDGMAHDLPRELWPRIASAIGCHVNRARPALQQFTAGVGA